MPNVDSAKKRNRQSIKRNLYNSAIKSKIKTVEKKVHAFLTSDSLEEAKKELSLFFKAIDKAVGKNVIKKNTGARRKSALSKKVYGANKK